MSDFEMAELESFAARWEILKEHERRIAQERRELEDMICQSLKISPDAEGTKTVLNLKITTKQTRKIDSAKAEELAIKHACQGYLTKLFRWKAELVKKEWDEAPDHVKKALLPAIERKPARPTFATKQKKENK